MREVSYHGATFADVPEILEFWATAAENDNRPTDTAEAVDALIARDPDALILAFADDKIVGTIIAGFDGWRYHLYRLAVSPDLRRQGIGQALLNRAEMRLAQFGATRFDAMVLDDNETGQSLWVANGYTPQPEWSRWIRKA
jgi:ribosomal protein S18 acetylase RimI-like enzyme